MKTTKDVASTMCQCGVRLKGQWKVKGYCASCSKDMELAKVENKNNNSEVVEMNNIEKCVECGVELVGEVVVPQKGICRDCVEALSQGIDDVDGSLEEIKAKNIDIESSTASDLEAEAMNYMQDVESGVIPTKEEVAINKIANKLNIGLRNAINSGAIDHKVRIQKKLKVQNCITSRQIDGILKSYKLVTGVDMNEAQIKCIKTLNGTQALYVRRTIQTANDGIKAKAREEFKKNLATNAQ